MRQNTKIILAGTSAALLAYGLKRSLGGKRFQTMPYGYGIKLKRSVTVNRSLDDLYRYWRRLENIPRLFDNITLVSIIDEKHSQWMFKAPGGFILKWNAEITVDRENEMIGWRSVGRADLDNAGYVRFESDRGGRETVVSVALQYNPPAGKLGAVLATLFGEKPGTLIEKALQKFKELMEAESGAAQENLTQSVEPVETASEDSFPASDAPAWTGTTGPRA
jgi:uncharacterized membrane protein